MKAKRKRIGTKAQIRALKERERRTATAIFLAFILLIVAFSAYFTYTSLNPSPNQTINPASSQLKATIVDHLSLTFPNQTFIQTATTMLEQAGYTVDYHPGEEVTVEFYRNLPTGENNLIILRVHSALAINEGGQELGFVDLFSSELYSTTRYVSEQLTDQVSKCMFSTRGPAYFGISPPFVQRSMKGTFKNAIIILMGCDGLAYTTLARAFIQRGAKTCIGWNGLVLASHTDRAATNLLQHLILEKQTIGQAVENAMNEVGADPTYRSLLTYYPLEVRDQTM